MHLRFICLLLIQLVLPFLLIGAPVLVFAMSLYYPSLPGSPAILGRAYLIWTMVVLMMPLGNCVAMLGFVKAYRQWVFGLGWCRRDSSGRSIHKGIVLGAVAAATPKRW